MYVSPSSQNWPQNSSINFPPLFLNEAKNWRNARKSDRICHISALTHILGFLANQKYGCPGQSETFKVLCDSFLEWQPLPISVKIFHLQPAGKYFSLKTDYRMHFLSPCNSWNIGSDHILPKLIFSVTAVSGFSKPGSNYNIDNILKGNNSRKGCLI